MEVRRNFCRTDYRRTNGDEDMRTGADVRIHRVAKPGECLPDTAYHRLSQIFELAHSRAAYCRSRLGPRSANNPPTAGRGAVVNGRLPRSFYGRLSGRGEGTLFEPLGRTRKFLDEATSDVIDNARPCSEPYLRRGLLTDGPSHKGSAVAGRGLREDGLEVVLDRVL